MFCLFSGGKDMCSRTYRFQTFVRGICQKSFQNMKFLSCIRKPHGQFHKKSIQLGFRKRKCSCRFQRILRSDYKKRFFQLSRHSVNSHLPFFHTLQKTGLGTGSSPVNFICQNRMSKNRSFSELKFALFLIIIIQSRHI